MLSFTHIAPAERIIVALDCDRDTALEIADDLKGAATWMKVGLTLYLAEGASIITALKERGFKVFLDLKLHDIPHQVEGAAASIANLGADLLTVHTTGGVEMMRSALAGVGKAEEPPAVIGVTVLTSMSQENLAQIGVEKPVDQQVEALASLAQEAGLAGVVASPHEAARLRELLGPDAIIVTPGVRPVGSSTDDQSRVATPAQAIAAGASHIVIGRPITQAHDPLRAFNSIVEGL